MMYMSGKAVRRDTRVRCAFGDIEKKRMSLKQEFYTTSRPLSHNEINMIMTPLFASVHLELKMAKQRLQVVFSNAEQHPVQSTCIVEMLNDWNMQDKVRRFLIKSLTNANKNNIYEYKSEGVKWICPLEVYYVFDDGDDSDEGQDDGVWFTV